MVARDERPTKGVVAEIEGSYRGAALPLTTRGDVDIRISNADVAVLGPSNAATKAAQ
ncbi:hypothetical protein [Allobranchiibius sp. CTAmp26]|uniref:hypothetical protein n=1 Tax=Allobranchiibius sp. CTAmp26 TaxID=2815214 RepID=UPI001AA19C99|nr:hypothetical protein [Allobranchiibius sp. CTAmp26]MBO1756563.1 hypothetical protein [Allobranchiibius sp. CTAmp26]